MNLVPTSLRRVLFVLVLALASASSALLGCSDDESSAAFGDGGATGPADDEDAGASGASGSGGGAGTSGSPGTSAKLSFSADGTLVDFTGKNSASYYQQDLGKWRFVVVVNDVLGDKYFSLSVTGTGGAMVEERSYDCSMASDDEAMGQGKMEYRTGEGDAEKVWVQREGLPCTITIATIGEVGERLVGSFSATLTPKNGAGDDIEVSGGNFDVERKDF